jgi:acyl-CoA thioester hydrolase
VAGLSTTVTTSFITVRVLYADTDLAGVVYHANYLRFFEAARTQALYDAGIDIARLHEEQNLVFTITEVTMSYHHPARYGDLLRVEVFPIKCGPARLVLGYRVLRPGHDTPCVTGATTIAAVDMAGGKAGGKVVRLPSGMREHFSV